MIAMDSANDSASRSMRSIFFIGKKTREIKNPGMKKTKTILRMDRIRFSICFNDLSNADYIVCHAGLSSIRILEKSLLSRMTIAY